MNVVTTGRPSLRAERGHPPLQIVTTDFHVDEDDRGLRLRQPNDDLVGAFGEGVRVGAARCQHGHRRRRRLRQIAWQLDIDRQRALARAAQHPRDVGGSRCWIGEQRLVTGDLAIDRHLGIDRAGLVVEDETAGALAHPGRSRDDDDRRAFRVGAGDRIDQIECPCPEGDDGDAEPAVVARRRVSCETDARLVAQREVRKDAALLDHLEERQHEIAGDPEDFTRAMALEALQQRSRERRHAATVRIHSVKAIRLPNGR
jgi:hypothetical protein